MGWQPYNSEEKPKNEPPPPPPSPYGAPPGGQTPFGQQPQQQPFGQQPQQPFGQQQPGYYGGMPYTPAPPKKGRNPCAIIALVLVAVTVICVICCVGVMAYAFSNEETAYMGWQISAAVGESYPVDWGIVCENSQAARFTEAFHQRYYVNYTGGVTLSVNNTSKNGSVYTHTGTITGSAGSTGYNSSYFGDYSATFVMGDDKGFLGMFGHCIEEIHQTRPALDVP